MIGPASTRALQPAMGDDWLVSAPTNSVAPSGVSAIVLPNSAAVPSNLSCSSQEAPTRTKTKTAPSSGSTLRSNGAPTASSLPPAVIDSALPNSPSSIVFDGLRYAGVADQPESPRVYT